MQLRELNLSNSILNTELRELEAHELQVGHRVLQLYSRMNTLSGKECTCKSATSKYGMHLQKCNLKIWNSPVWAPSLEENQLIIPVWTVLRKALVEGECEFWDCLRPGFAPNPFLRFFLFWGLSSWLVLVGSSSSMEAHALADALHAFNACITSEAGGGQDSHPRHRTLSSLLSLSFLGLR